MVCDCGKILELDREDSPIFSYSQLEEIIMFIFGMMSGAMKGL